MKQVIQTGKLGLDFGTKRLYSDYSETILGGWHVVEKKCLTKR